jgi:hypothetical protein
LYETSHSGIGIAKAKRILDFRATKKVFTLMDLADVTQITFEQWNAWNKEGIVTIDRPQEEVVASLPTPEPSETGWLHLTLLEMNKSLQQLREEVQTLRLEAILKSEVDESLLPVYNTPSAPTNGLHASEDSSDKTLTLNTETIKTLSKHVQTLKRASTPQKRTVPFRARNEPYRARSVPYRARTVPYRPESVPCKNRAVPCRKRTVPCKNRTVPCKKRTVSCKACKIIYMQTPSPKAYRTVQIDLYFLIMTKP